MNINDLKPVSTFAQRMGVKAMLYGQAGIGKTPICCSTAPRPVLLVTESGVLSVRNMNTPAWEAYTPERIKEFFDWFTKSNDAKNFDTLVIDSGSQVAEIELADQLKKNKDGRKAYGELSKICMEFFSGLYYMPQKHIVMICKLTKAEIGKQVINQGGAFVVESTFQMQPYFPGQDLNVKVPHMYDAIWYMGRAQVPGQQGQVTAIRTVGTDEIMARDRSGNLAELEPPNLAQLFEKAMR